MIDAKDITAVGKFQKTHALKGELNAILDIDTVFFTEGNAMIVDVDGIFVPFFISNIRKKGNTSFLIQIDGIDSETDARQFVNKTIYAEKSKLSLFLDLDEDKLLDEEDLKGYVVVDADTKMEIGTICSIDTSTQNVLFIVKTQEGNEIFIPAVDRFITDVDDEKKVIEMTLPEGLTEINDTN